MKRSSITQSKALDLLKKGASISDYEVHFDAEKVEALDALLLRKHGVPLPEDLVFYADEATDFEEDGDLMDAELAQGGLSRVLRVEVQVTPEIADWVNQNRIDVDRLLSDLIKGFYRNMKTVSSARSMGTNI